MSVYETIFILKPSLTDEDAAKVVAKMRAVVEKGGGEILKTENWGKKKMAYEVRKEKKGAYFSSDSKGRGRWWPNWNISIGWKTASSNF